MIDASGRGSRSRHWLHDLGFAPPPQDELAVNVTYTSCTFRRHSAGPNPFHAVFMAPEATCPQPVGLLAQEGDRWILSCGTYPDRPAPETLAALREAVERDAPAEIHTALCAAQALTTPLHYHYARSIRHRYEKLNRFPDGFLVIGDALCSLNPVYGQGMSVAALQALALKKALQRPFGRLWRRYFKQAARIVATPWALSHLSDLALPSVTGKRPWGFRWYQRALDRVRYAATQDPAVAMAVLHVIHLQKAPTTLLRPGVVWRIVWANLPTPAHTC